MERRCSRLENLTLYVSCVSDMNVCIHTSQVEMEFRIQVLVY